MNQKTQSTRYTEEQLKHMCQEALANRGSPQWGMFIMFLSASTGKSPEWIESAMQHMVLNGSWE